MGSALDTSPLKASCLPDLLEICAPGPFLRNLWGSLEEPFEVSLGAFTENLEWREEEENAETRTGLEKPASGVLLNARNQNLKRPESYE